MQRLQRRRLASFRSSIYPSSSVQSATAVPYRSFCRPTTTLQSLQACATWSHLTFVHVQIPLPTRSQSRSIETKWYRFAIQGTDDILSSFTLPPLHLLTRKPCCRRETARYCCNFPRWRPAAILDLIESEITPFHPSVPKTLPYWLSMV